MIPTDLIKGSLKTVVLKLLLLNGHNYGYEIIRSDSKNKLDSGFL
jgi:DNA-binding PadR family transcriptional regulator